MRCLMHRTGGAPRCWEAAQTRVQCNCFVSFEEGGYIVRAENNTSVRHVAQLQS